MVTEAKKKANNRWDSENMANIACKVKKPIAEEFRCKMTANGLTCNTVLIRFVKDCIAGKFDNYLAGIENDLTREQAIRELNNILQNK